ncbi:MAG: TetR/AcrR family transcriptional regulator [Solirubrobacterales bacterium]|nr:TetR/AcrR family transcriptional regulator [Solirubrobacterales bacterium]
MPSQRIDSRERPLRHLRREGSSGAQVAAFQRSRMLAATLRAVESEGYAQLTVSAIIAGAHVSRKTFYELFESTEHCFLEALEQTLERAVELTRAAFEAEPEWREAMRAALLALLGAMEEERGLAHVCVVEALRAQEAVLACRAAVLARAAKAIEQGQRAGDGRYPRQPLAAIAVAGAIAELLHARLIDGEHQLSDLMGPSMSMIVMPYLGRAAAQEELEVPALLPGPACAPAPRPRAPKQREDLNMRLTYRTARALAAVAESPGASNRSIAARAGITDAGQVSKLMRRLERLELVRNDGEGQPRGAANAWRLTPRGERIQRVAQSLSTSCP